MKQLKIATLSSIGLVMVLAFQNCGQQSAVGIEPGAVTSAKASTDTMIITPNTDNSAADDGAVAAEDPASCKDKEGHHQSGDQDHQSKEQSQTSCSGINVADILLKIESIRVGSEGNVAGAIALEEMDAAISMNKLHVTIRATKDVVKVKQLFMVLKVAGNKVLDMESLAHDLKTPSGQTAGIKVQLDSEVSLKAGEIYSLQFTIDPAQQIITNPVKCLFKPVIKSARIVVALVDTLKM